MRWLSAASLCSVMLFVSGCTGVFFHPAVDLPITPEAVGLRYEDIEFEARDGTALHGWWLPAGEPRGTVVFAHGNAANIANHLASVYWLPAAGYNVFIFDYRGYGRSSGSPSLPGVVEDLAAAVEVVREVKAVPAGEIAILGQSLGGSIAIVYAAEIQFEARPFAALIADSAFSGYRDIVQEKLAQLWLTWPLQIPLSYLVSGSYNPVDHIAAVAPTPLLLLHGGADEVVPLEHGRRLFERAREPKRFLIFEGGSHIEALHHSEFREALVHFLEESL